MNTRRPRVKPPAILKPRRVQSSQCSNAAEPVLKSAQKDVEPTITIVVPIESEENIDDISEESKDIKLPIDIKLINTSSTPSQKDAGKSNASQKPSIDQNSAANKPKPFRRIKNPVVNMIARRNIYQTSPIHGKSPVHITSPHSMRSPTYTYMFEQKLSTTPRKLEDNPNSSPKIGASANLDDEIFSTVPDGDECFKSPSNYCRPEPNSSPYTDPFSDDNTKSPIHNGNNMKVRQRIRPTPYFGHRRNSIQGTQSESDDETTRRQRHSSVSSTISTTSAYVPQSRHFFGLTKSNSRNRTESMSSNISDAYGGLNDIGGKPRRSHRSEEFQRIANAKKEFHQRLNGKIPDKSRLTMYDMIYYNPATNPMSKPSVKSESKDRMSDTSSISSVRTVNSRNSSVQNVSKVKSENTDSNQDAMPVPQLKLGPNGEIVLDEQSLVIETTKNKEAREMLEKSDIVYDDEFSGSQLIAFNTFLN